MRRFLPVGLLLVLCVAEAAHAQTGGGSLRGYVKDESGAVLPGVAVTANSGELMGPQTVVTDGTGYYRVLNLPPGGYTLTFELEGFATYIQEGIVLRAGANYSVDATLKISAIHELITVTAETPMLEVAKPSNVLNVEGEFQRHMPLQARRNWSDFLELTPGVNARPFDDGSGRMVYFGHGAELFHHAIQIEGMNANNYWSSLASHVDMSSAMIEDVQIKSGGVEASEPLSTGLVINVVTKSGGNDFRGSAGYAYQPIEWNADNTPKPAAGQNVTGNPTKQQVNQLDASVGGPISRDKIWFFFSYRYADLENGISRTAREMELLRGYKPDFEPFNNQSSIHQPYVKVTAQLNPDHKLNAYYQRDRLTYTGDREYNYEPILLYSTGGNLFGGKLTSVWGTKTTSQVTGMFNDKSGADLTTKEQLPGTGPMIDVHADVYEQAGRLFGTGRLVQGGNLQQFDLRPSSMLIFRGDVTHYVEEWGGSHEFQTGIYAAPRLTFDRELHYLNDGFVLEEHRLVDPNDISSGTIPFHRLYWDPPIVEILAARDRDIAIYFQDAWKPHPRLTLNLGIRADWVNRYDGIFDITRMSNALALGPRFGFSYLVTEDARNVLRASVVRVHEQVGGRDFSTYRGPQSRSSRRDVYDFNGDGIFETEFTQPLIRAEVAAHEFDPDLHQPWVDEAIIGFRKQFPKQFALDVAWIHRRFTHRYALVEINGFYPEEPGQPFGGYGRIDPDRGTYYQLTNNDYDKEVFNAIEITATQRLAAKFQFMAGLTRQWQHLSGTWNPTDPARFIQPEAYPNNKLIFPTRGLGDHNSLQGGTYGPMWRKYSIRLGGTWYAPGGIVFAASYTQLAGPWSGPLLTKLDANDPEVRRFGPAKVVSETGSVQSNILSTVHRFVGPTRSDGQVKMGDVCTLGLKVAKRFELGGRGELEVGANVFNLINASGHHQYTYNGANQTWNPNFLQERSRQSPRGLQLTFVFRY